MEYRLYKQKLFNVAPSSAVQILVVIDHWRRPPFSLPSSLYFFHVRKALAPLEGKGIGGEGKKSHCGIDCRQNGTDRGEREGKKAFCGRLLRLLSQTEEKIWSKRKAAINVLISPALLSEREQKAQRQVCPILLRQKSVRHTIQNGVTDRRRIDVFDFPESTVIESGEGN